MAKASVGNAELLQEMIRLQQENEKLAAQIASRAPKPSIKVSQPRAAGTNGATDKGSAGGAVSVYGLGRFPVTLYKEQWVKLLDMAQEIRTFIVAHEAEMHVKVAK